MMTDHVMYDHTAETREKRIEELEGRLLKVSGQLIAANEQLAEVRGERDEWWDFMTGTLDTVLECPMDASESALSLLETTARLRMKQLTTARAALDRLNSSADSMARDLNIFLSKLKHPGHGECQCRVCRQVVPEAVEALADAQEALAAINTRG